MPDNPREREWPLNLLNDIEPWAYPLPYDICGSIMYVLEGIISLHGRDVIIKRYRDKIPMKKIAEDLNITVTRANQIKIKVLNHLRSPYNVRYLQMGVSGMLADARENHDLSLMDRLESACLRIEDSVAIMEKAVSDQKSKPEKAGEGAKRPRDLDKLDLSDRAANCLVRAKIETICDLANLTPKQLMKIRCIGEKTFEEIVGKLYAAGYRLKDEDGLEGFKSLYTPNRQMPIWLRKCLSGYASRSEAASAGMNALISIDNLKLSSRSYYCLKHLGIRTYGDLAYIAPMTIAKAKNVRPAQFSEIIEKAHDAGITFKNEDGDSDGIGAAYIFYKAKGKSGKKP